MSSSVRIVEVGPRDGLQNEKRVWSLQERHDLVNLLADCCFDEIEVGSFVSPKWIPQMADTSLLYEGLSDVMQSHSDTRFSVLVPNEKGMDQALASGVKDISVFTAASDAFCQRNINCTIEESFERFEPIIQRAKDHHIGVRGYVSCVIDCPYSGAVSPESVARVALRLFEMGCREISLGDTIGKGTPETMRPMIQAVKKVLPVGVIAIHCHDTYGQAVTNILTCLEEGIRTVDSAIKGLGGCPYGGEKAKGNVATEQVLQVLHASGYHTGVHLEKLQLAIDFVNRSYIVQ